MDIWEKGGGDGPKGEEGCVGVKFKTKKHKNEGVKQRERERHK